MATESALDPILADMFWIMNEQNVLDNISKSALNKRYFDILISHDGEPRPHECALQSFECPFYRSPEWPLKKQKWDTQSAVSCESVYTNKQ